MTLSEDIDVHSLRLYEVLTSGKGLQGIVDTASAILDNPVLVADAGFKILAHAEKSDITDQLWLELIEVGVYPEEYIVKAINNDSLNSHVLSSGPPVIISDDESPNRFICKAILVDGTPLGFATCIEYDSAFSERDTELFGIFCKIVGTELRGNELLSHNYKRKQDFFISELLNGPVNEDFLKERLRQVGMRAKSNNFVLIFELADGNMSRENQIIYFINVLEQLIPNSHCIIYLNSIVALVIRDNPNLLGDDFTVALMKNLETMDMVCGISHCFNSISDMHVYYKQAKEAIRLGRKLRPGNRIYNYSRLSFYHMADIIGQTEELRAFCNPKLLEVFKYDETYKTKFAQTAYEYLNLDKNPNRTAERLDIHRNSVDYRIKRIEELFDFTFSDSEVAFSLYHSYKILEYLGDLQF